MVPALDYSQIARFYDALVRFDADIPFFLQECRRAEGPVLELMCGTGRVSVPLLTAGVDLTCIDSTPEMLAILRRKLARRKLSATVLEQDVTRLSVSAKYALVLIPLHSFEELSVAEERQTALASIRELLAPGGRFICTLHNPAISLQTFTQGPRVVTRSAVEGGELILATDVTYDPESGIVEGTQTLVRQDASQREMWRRSLPLRYVLIEEDSFRLSARNTGFVVENLYGDYDRSPFDSFRSPTMIWILGSGSTSAVSATS